MSDFLTDSTLVSTTEISQEKVWRPVRKLNWDNLTEIRNRIEQDRAVPKIAIIPVSTQPAGTPQQVTNVIATESPYKTDTGDVNHW
jgi:hypothetical protein